MNIRRSRGRRLLGAVVAAVAVTAGPVVAPILATGPGGASTVIAISGPLTDGHPADQKIAAMRESGSNVPIIVENELLVRRNLPFATRTVRQKLGW